MQADSVNTTTRRAFLSTAAVAVPAIAAAPVAALAAPEPDPIFAAIDAHRRASLETNKAFEVLSSVEAELDAAGDLFPSVLSRGNPYSGLDDRPISRTHADIDRYSPTYLYPDDNKREHAELEASMQRHDARQPSAKKAAKDALEKEIDVINDLVESSPTTMKGILALLAYEQDELWEKRRDSVEARHLDVLCCSLRSALQALYPSV